MNARSDIDNTLLPAVLTTEDGEPRRVGVEIEFAGLELDAVAEVVAGVFGGRISPQTEYEITITNPEGDFQVELDVGILKRRAQQRKEADEDPGRLEQMTEEVVAALMRQVAPCEVVTPPLPFERLPEVDRLVDALSAAGGRGTHDAMVYAFGVQFNPTAPSLRPAGIVSYLQAYALLHEWLMEQIQVDTTRRITPFIDPYPAAYVRLILQPGYRPTREGLIKDYLTYNPTRNRALDLLPLFAHLNPEQVYAALNNLHIKAVKARPTYHYRLPNSGVGDPHWRLTDEWRRWLAVEVLAQAPEQLKAMAADYLNWMDRPVQENEIIHWATRAENWLERARCKNP